MMRPLGPFIVIVNPLSEHGKRHLLILKAAHGAKKILASFCAQASITLIWDLLIRVALFCRVAAIEYFLYAFKRCG